MMHLPVVSILLLLVPGGRGLVAQPQQSMEALLGTWHGTSTCTDRAAAPSCRDEVVVYEFRRGDKAGAVIAAADKIVEGKRVPMGELEFTWDATLGRWVADFTSPRVSSRWSLALEGDRLTGEARLVPGNQKIRAVQLTRGPMPKSP